ncbi:ABATE domain-containing protein [Methylobacillus caricis]|uniref:CGNR zinc finger domain-containing protein n=1 Tax=Methylobacillus caricis TaxID=1971611 RepID=UPI001CFFF332|nr:ABATE domain-containing protein [Methylobacillus caricis]MCB5186769.1 ABATE domain-containing protein [Methylobacillus caricis]
MKLTHTSIYFRESIGGHLALDFLNTVHIAEGVQVDDLQTDQDVLKWLSDHQVVNIPASFQVKPGALLTAARNLREAIRNSIMALKQSKPVALDEINGYLKSGSTYQELHYTGQRMEVYQIRPIDTGEQLLAPVAEAAAEILASPNLDLVRKCESMDCVLWFYDRTKGHKRRWCSMAVCGNRHKVSSYRQRQSLA